MDTGSVKSNNTARFDKTLIFFMFLSVLIGVHRWLKMLFSF